MMQTQQQKFTQPPVYGVTFPEGEKPRVSLFSRDSLTRACRGNERMASVLDYFLYEGSWEIDRQKLGEGCKVVAFTRKHADILKRLTFQLSRKSLIGFLDIFNEWKFVLSEKYHNHYTVDFDALQAAIDNPPLPKERKPRTRKGCKVEAITNEDNTSTLLQKVEELQQKVELLQHYVEELQPLGCNSSTLQRDFSALVEWLQGHFPEEHILTYYPLLSSSNVDTFASAHVSTVPADFLPETDSFENEATPEIGANDGQLNTLASANTPGEPENSPLSAQTRHSHIPSSLQGTDGAATEGTGRPRASGNGHSAIAATASQATLQQQAASVTTQNSTGTRQEKQVSQPPLSLKEDEPHIKPETPAQRRRRIEQREKEIWALVEEKLGTKYLRTHRQLKANVTGMERLIEDDTSDEAINEGLEKLSDFWKNQFDLAMFHAKLPSLVRKQAQQVQSASLQADPPRPRSYTGFGKQLKAARNLQA